MQKTDTKHAAIAATLSAAYEKKRGEEGKLRGRGRRLGPEQINGATDSSRELIFLIKWKEGDEVDLVPSEKAELKCLPTVNHFPTLLTKPSVYLSNKVSN